MKFNKHFITIQNLKQFFECNVLTKYYVGIETVADLDVRQNL